MTSSDFIELKKCLEALLFVSEKPLHFQEIQQILKTQELTLKTLLNDLKLDYEHRGVILSHTAQGYEFISHPDTKPVLSQLFKKKSRALSKATLETLAIIAYRQPVTRSEIQQIRGVDVGAVLNYLREEKLIKVSGKREGPGQPLEFQTTPFFLKTFSLGSLDELPSLRNLELSPEERRQMSDVWDTQRLQKPGATSQTTPSDNSELLLP